MGALLLAMASTEKANGSAYDTEHGGIIDHAPVVPHTKVKFIYKLINFSFAAYALSWFFEGWREIGKDFSVANAAILAGGTVFTLLFLGVHAYWVYFEEKAKGTLKKRIGLFEKINLALSKRKSEVVVTEKRES
jgi:hypothetical protein